MTYKELLKALASYDGNWDDEVVFVNYNKEPYKEGSYEYPTFNITSVGCYNGKCRLNNAYDNGR